MFLSGVELISIYHFILTSKRDISFPFSLQTNYRISQIAVSSWCCCPWSFCHGKGFLELLDDHLIAPPPSHPFILLQPHCRVFKCWTTTVTYIQPSITLPANRGWCFWDDPSKNRRSIWIQSSYTPIVFFILFLSHSYCTSSVNQDTVHCYTQRNQEFRCNLSHFLFLSMLCVTENPLHVWESLQNMKIIAVPLSFISI